MFLCFPPMPQALPACSENVKAARTFIILFENVFKKGNVDYRLLGRSRNGPAIYALVDMASDVCPNSTNKMTQPGLQERDRTYSKGDNVGSLNI
jgi:hypothetical protein